MAMAHRCRIASAPPASWSPACRRRAPYRRRALWTCPACGRPVRNGLHPQSRDTGAHSPLEISRATAGDQAGAEAARFPQVHSAFLSIYSHGKPRHDLNPKASTCPQNRGNLSGGHQQKAAGDCAARIRIPLSRCDHLDAVPLLRRHRTGATSTHTHLRRFQNLCCIRRALNPG